MGDFTYTSCEDMEDHESHEMGPQEVCIGRGPGNIVRVLAESPKIDEIVETLETPRKIDEFAKKLRNDKTEHTFGGGYVFVEPADTWDIDKNQPAEIYITIDGCWKVSELEKIMKEVYGDERGSGIQEDHEG